jgi:hypothetical protein
MSGKFERVTDEGPTVRRWRYNEPSALGDGVLTITASVADAVLIRVTEVGMLVSHPQTVGIARDDIEDFIHVLREASKKVCLTCNGSGVQE